MRGAIYSLCSTNVLKYKSVKCRQTVSLSLCMLHVYAHVEYNRRIHIYVCSRLSSDFQSHRF